MSERLRSDSAKYQYKTNFTKMSEGDLGTRKTLFVLVIVVGCFAVLWPKVFYPMLVGPANQRMKPNSLDKGCCDVISDIDVNTIKIMSELCNNIVQQTDKKPLTGQEIVIRCRNEVLNTCGIDISAILQEQVRLGRTFKQIVDEVRSLNGSLCFKYKFGISPWRLGATHKITINPIYVRQERPAHLRPEMLHPALREKGRAIAQPYQSPSKGTPPKFAEGRPGPVPGVRPPIGGAGHVVHPQKSTSSMGLIMPIYTVGIVIFFSYTLMKLLFKKKPEGPGAPLYPPVEPSMAFRKAVFESQKSRPPQEPGSRDEELDLLRRRLRETELAMERIVAQMAQVPLRSQKEPTPNGTIVANGNAKQSQEHEQPSVKVLGMEMTASCEGGEKWSRPESPVMPSASPPPPEPVEPPQEIYLEGALPAQSQILVADSTTEAEPDVSSSSPDPAVVLASKMTLSVISLDSQENDIGIETIEKTKLRNGDLDEIEQETLDEEIVDESKYTTASGATAAEHDISEGEQTDEEHDIEEEIEKVAEYVVDNGAQHIEDVENLQEIANIELNLDNEPEPIIDDIEKEYNEIASERSKNDSQTNFSTPEILESISDIKYDDIDIDTLLPGTDIDTWLPELKSDDKENKTCEKDDIRESAVKFSENVLANEDENEVDIMSAEAIESIADVIDEVINTGTRMSELISAEKEAESDDDIKIDTSTVTFKADDLIEAPLENGKLETNRVSIENAPQTEPLKIGSEEKEKETEDNKDTQLNKEMPKPVSQDTKKVAVTSKEEKIKPVESESEEEVEIEVEEIEVEEEEEQN